MAADEDILRTLDRSAVSYQMVLTKADRLVATELEQRQAAVAAALARRPAAFPQIMVTSSQSGAGIAELRAAIARLVRQRATSP
jgi:GTP-binding protein